MEFIILISSLINPVTNPNPNKIQVSKAIPRPRRDTAVSSEAWAKLREWAILAGKGRLLLSGSVVLASLKASVHVVAQPGPDS